MLVLQITSCRSSTRTECRQSSSRHRHTAISTANAHRQQITLRQAGRTSRAMSICVDVMDWNLKYIILCTGLLPITVKISRKYCTCSALPHPRHPMSASCAGPDSENTWVATGQGMFLTTDYHMIYSPCSKDSMLTYSLRVWSLLCSREKQSRRGVPHGRPRCHS